MSFERTTQPAHETAQEYLDMGLLAACVPINFAGEPGLWTSAIETEGFQPQNQIDSLAVAIVAIKRAYREAESHGGHKACGTLQG